MEAEINIKSDNNIQEIIKKLNNANIDELERLSEQINSLIDNKVEDEIKLNKAKDILRLKIKDEDGNDTGNFLEFNLGDLDYLLILQDMMEADKKNREYLKNQYTIIDKKQDHKGKKLFSSNEEAKIKATNEFYKKEAEIYDMFLGKDGVKKLLNGRKLTLARLDEIDEIIEKAILPKLQIKAEDIKKDIMEKYSNKNKRDDVIE